MRDNPLPCLAIICPCYNEAEGIGWSMSQLLAKLASLQSRQLISPDSFLCLIDDGSEDSTWELIEAATHSENIVGIKLLGNVGHQNALAAGLHYVVDKCDCAISLDLDLQDDLDAIDLMIADYVKEKDIVFGVRSKRDVDSFMKRNTALLYYKLLDYIGVKIVHNHADFRLVSQKVLQIFNQLPEQNLFLRGIFANMPFPSSQVNYFRKSRKYGKSKYSPVKMVTLAWDGIFGFSLAPLRLLGLIGLGVFVFSLGLVVYVLWSWWFSKGGGWFLAGLQRCYLCIYLAV